MDESLKEANVWRSIRKYFIDNLNSTVPVHFDRIITPPTDSAPDQWVNIMVEAPTPAHVSDAVMTLFLFSKQDREGIELAELRDTVLELLYPGSIDLYDAEWNKIGALSVFVDSQSSTNYNSDQSKMIYIQCALRWGSVWS